MTRRASLYIENPDYQIRKQQEASFDSATERALEYINSRGSRGSYDTADRLINQISDYTEREPYARRIKVRDIAKSVRKLTFLSNVRVFVKELEASVSVKAQITGLIGIVQKDYRVAFRLPPVEVHLLNNLSSLRIFTNVRTSSKRLRDFSTEGQRYLGSSERTGNSIYRYKKRYQASPHCQKVNEPCWGDFGTPISQFKRGFDFAGMFCTIKEYLTSISGRDGAGRLYVDLLVGDPNIRLYSRKDMGLDSTSYTNPFMWSPKWSRWGRVTHLLGEPTLTRFYISPNEYIEGDDIGELSPYNITYTNPYDWRGQTLCPSLASPMPDCRSVMKIDSEKKYAWPLYHKRVRTVSESVQIISDPM